MQRNGKIVVGLDCPLKRALELLPILARHHIVYGVKFHILAEAEMYRRDGEISFMHELQRYENLKKWLDFKYCDTPETVRQRLELHLNPGIADFVTVMACSGPKTLEAAVQATGSQIQVIAVTQLTSKSEQDVYDETKVIRAESVQQYALWTYNAGVGILVCSGNELATLNQDERFRQMQKFVPGMKLGGQANTGQVMTTSIGDAYRNGATLTVHASAICGAENPEAVLDQIAAEIEQIPEGS